MNTEPQTITELSQKLSEEMSAIQAQRNLDQKRQSLGIRKSESNTKLHETLEQTLERLKQVKPQDLTKVAQANEESRSTRVESLKAQWNAPKLHADRAVCSEGQWGETLSAVTRRLGSGFIVGLVGGYGPGKTQLGVEVMRHQVEQRLKSACYLTAVRFFMRVKATYRPDAQQTEEQVVDNLCRPSLLVIDEIGKRSDSAWENLLLFELLDTRYHSMKDTLVISNQSVDEFTAGIGAGIASRMREKGGLIECTWPSFRQ